MQSSIYDMDLTNEIHYDPVDFYNYNLDPTRRYGSETNSTYRATDTLLFRDGFAYTRAIFREGPFAGNDIPLVSRYTANVGVSWNIWQKYLVADATVRYWSSRRMDNDQFNIRPLIPPSRRNRKKRARHWPTGWRANKAVAAGPEVPHRTFDLGVSFARTAIYPTIKCGGLSLKAI